MDGLLDFWKSLSKAARAGLVCGLIAIVLLVSATAYWTLRTPYGVLFSGLSQGDMAAMAGELDKMKVPYRVGDDNGTLLVPEASVHKTRLALMGRDLPLHGAVGFELFNNMDFGVSEFVQKVDYQRALQGELTRTILAIDEVQNARVHLALPDQGLFSKDAQRAKASVTLTLKPGRALQPIQVQGVQRLVAASVPDIQPQDVTVLDDHGVPLSRLSGPDSNALEATGSAELELKRGVETYLAQKATAVLDRTFGAGVAVVSVDAVFVQEQMRVTTEEVLPAHGPGSGQIPTGVIVRERQSTKGGDAGTATNQDVVTTSETEYQAGRRTEQVVTPAGAVKRLAVAVVLRQPMSDVDLQRVREVVAAALGISHERGDVIAVQAFGAAPSDSRQGAPATVSPEPRSAPDAVDRTPRPAENLAGRAVVASLAALLLMAAIGVLLWRPVRRAKPPRALSDEERAQLLQVIQTWVVSDVPAPRQ